MLNDLRHAFRVLRHSPAFTLAAAIVLALGIGANTTIFSIINTMLLHPLPYAEPERLGIVFSENPKRDIKHWPASQLDFIDWRAQNHVFEQMAGFEETGLNLTSGGEPERLSAARVSPNFFSLLGVKPFLGRTFRPEEENAERDHVVVLSYGLWKRRFGGDAGVINRVLMLDGIACTVVGVMPPELHPVEVEELWSPLALNQTGSTELRGHRGTTVFARLKAGVSFEQANADLKQIAARIGTAYPKWNKDLTVRVASAEEEQVAQYRDLLVLLWAAVGFVLLLACANVANLLLAKTTGRRREIAIRLSLGATRVRIFRQMLIESTMLAMLGGALAMLPAVWGVDLVVLLLDDPQAAAYIHLDGAVLLFNAMIALATGLMFGVLPAFSSSRTAMGESSKQNRSRGAAGSGNRTRNLLVASEVAISMMLLAGAGLAIESVGKLRTVKAGFEATGVLTMSIALPGNLYHERKQQIAFYRQLLEKLRTVPGLRSAGITSRLPLTEGDQAGSLLIEGRGAAKTVSEVNLVSVRSTSPDYFRAMGIALVRGRYFKDGDAENTALTAIMNEAAARKYWPGENPLGKQIKIETRIPEEDRWKTVVGVVANVRHDGLAEPSKPEVYFPYTQSPRPVMHLAAKSGGDPEHLGAALRHAVQSIDPRQPVFNVRTMRRIVNNSIDTERVTSILLTIFAGLAVLLASVGLYGVMSYLVTQRTHEIGVRVALGAREQDIMRLVIGRGMWLAGAGLAVGAAAAIGAGTLISSALYGVSPLDPAVLITAAAVLTAVSLIANYVPARRATRVDPVAALRDE